MFCKKLEFANIHILANNKFLGIIVQICSSHVHVFPVIWAFLWNILWKMYYVEPMSNQSIVPGQAL